MNIYSLVSIAFFAQLTIRGNKILFSLHAIEMGASPFVIGLLISMFAFIPFFLAVAAGRVSDRFGVRFPILFGSLGMGLGILPPYIFPHLATLFVSAICFGISNLFFHVPIQHLIGSLGSGKTRTNNFGFFSVAAAMAGFVGPLFSGFSIERFDHEATYLFLALSCFWPGAAIFILLKKNPTLGSGKKSDRKSSVMDLIKNPTLRRTFITSGMVITGVHLYAFYFPIYGHSVGLSPSMIGVVLSVHAAAAFAARVMMSALAKKIPEEKLLTYSVLISGATFLFFPVFDQVIVLALISFILGLGLGCGQPLSIIITYNRSPQGRYGEALGARITVNKFTQFVVPLFFGSVGSVLGMIPVFWSNAVFLFFGGYLNSKSKND